MTKLIADVAMLTDLGLRCDNSAQEMQQKYLDIANKFDALALKTAQLGFTISIPEVTSKIDQAVSFFDKEGTKILQRAALIAYADKHGLKRSTSWKSIDEYFASLTGLPIGTVNSSLHDKYDKELKMKGSSSDDGVVEITFDGIEEHFTPGFQNGDNASGCSQDTRLLAVEYSSTKKLSIGKRLKWLQTHETDPTKMLGHKQHAFDEALVHISNDETHGGDFPVKTSHESEIVLNNGSTHNSSVGTHMTNMQSSQSHKTSMSSMISMDDKGLMSPGENGKTQATNFMPAMTETMPTPMPAMTETMPAAMPSMPAMTEAMPTMSATAPTISTTMPAMPNMSTTTPTMNVTMPIAEPSMLTMNATSSSMPAMEMSPSQTISAPAPPNISSSVHPNMNMSTSTSASTSSSVTNMNMAQTQSPNSTMTHREMSQTSTIPNMTNSNSNSTNHDSMTMGTNGQSMPSSAAPTQSNSNSPTIDNNQGTMSGMDMSSTTETSGTVPSQIESSTSSMHNMMMDHEMGSTKTNYAQLVMVSTVSVGAGVILSKTILTKEKLSRFRRTSK